ncbi:MAG TPA: hypothetical protein VF815_23510 [Myxococcaceae bacterium]|jgi:hypothetical protein
MSISKRICGVIPVLPLCLVLMACGGDPEKEPTPPPEEPEPELPVIEPRLSVIQVQVFERGCNYSQCHAPGQAEEGLELGGGKTYEELINKVSYNAAARSEGRRLVVPGKPEESFLVMKLRGPLDPKYGALMPRGSSEGARQNEYDAIVEWIRRGALND